MLISFIDYIDQLSLLLTLYEYLSNTYPIKLSSSYIQKSEIYLK